MRCTQLSRVVTLLCAGRCGKSRWRKTLASQPLGRDPRSRTHRTVSPPPGALVQRRSRALRLYPSRIPWARVVRACHSFLARHPRARTPAPSASDPETLGRTDTVHSPFQNESPDTRLSTSDTEAGSGLSPKPGLEAASSRNPDLMLHQSDTDLTLSPLNFLRVSGKKRPKTVPADQRAPTQDFVTSLSGLAMKQAADKPPTTPKGYLRSLGRCPLPVLGSVPFPLPVHSGFQCPEVPMSRCFDSGFQCLGVPMSRGRENQVVLIKS